MKKFLERFLYSQNSNKIHYHGYITAVAVKRMIKLQKESAVFYKTKESIALGNDVNKLILN
jgi:hypothetical protein